MRLARIMLLIPLLSAVMASISFAEFRLTPTLLVREEFNDNIYLEHKDRNSDFITTIAPGLSLYWDTSRIKANLVASVVLEKYLNNTEEDRFGPGESTQSTRLDFEARILQEMLFLRVSDVYQRVPIDEGGVGGEGNKTVNLSDSNRFQLNPYLLFRPLQDTTLRLDYTYEHLWYKEEAGDDAETHRYAASLTRELTPRLSMSLNTSLSQFRPKDPVTVLAPDAEGAYEYDQKNLSFGLTFEATDRLVFTGYYGRGWLDYDVREDSDSKTWSVGATYELSRIYKMGLKYDKGYTVSVEDGTARSDRISGHIERDDRFKLRLGGFLNKSEYEEISRVDDSHGVDLSAEFPFNDRVGMAGRLSYSHFERTGDDEDGYDRYGANVSLYYEIPLGRISLGYTCNLSESDSVSDDDYLNNIVFLVASLTF